METVEVVFEQTVNDLVGVACNDGTCWVGRVTAADVSRLWVEWDVVHLDQPRRVPGPARRHLSVFDRRGREWSIEYFEGVEGHRVGDYRLEPIPQIHASFELVKLALAFGEVERATLHPDGRPETDTTHTVMLGLVAMELAALVPGIDIGKVALFALVHDLVEAVPEVGDTDTFRATDETRAAKKAREAEGMRILEGRLGRSRVLGLLQLYEEQQVLEARFVRYLDKAMPKATHELNGCASMVAKGCTLGELVLAHTTQGDKLDRQYPELAPFLRPVFDLFCRRSELALQSTPRVTPKRTTLVDPYADNVRRALRDDYNGEACVCCKRWFTDNEVEVLRDTGVAHRTADSEELICGACAEELLADR